MLLLYISCIYSHRNNSKIIMLSSLPYLPFFPPIILWFNFWEDVISINSKIVVWFTISYSNQQVKSSKITVSQEFMLIGILSMSECANCMSQTMQALCEACGFILLILPSDINKLFLMLIEQSYSTVPFVIFAFLTK